MSWSSVGTAVLPLVGVALGTGGSFIGQYLGTRTTRDKARADRYAALRAERKEAIREFLEAAQQVERLAAARQQTGDQPQDSEAVSDRLWFLQKCVDLLGTAQLRDAAYRYTERLSRALWDGCPADTSVWEYIGERRHPFLQAAREELDVPELQQEALTE
jgi:hypothetical protein